MNHKIDFIKLFKLEICFIILFNITMLFYQKMNYLMILVLGILIYISLYRRFIKLFNKLQTLIVIACIFIPTSFVSILGTDYGSLPLTWFNFSIISTYLIILTKKFKFNYYFLSPILLAILGCISFFNCISFIDVVKQLLTIILFFIAFFIGDHLSKYNNKIFIDTLRNFYVLSTFSFSLTIIIQSILAKYFNIVVGNYEVLGNNRIVNAGLMGDYSFATIFLATGFLIVFIEYFEKKQLNYLILFVLRFHY